MQRYFIPAQQMNQISCQLIGQDAHHIAHVLRMRPGEQIICCNGEGKTVQAQIMEVTNDLVTCEIIAVIDQQRELPFHIWIAQGLPKGDKLEWIIQKGTELGAHRFVPFTSMRTIVKYDGKKEAKKLERWKKIIKEAAEQSHRDVLPLIDKVHSFKELLTIKADVKLVAYEEMAKKEVRQTSFFRALEQIRPGQSMLIVIGPEGGLEEQEVVQLEKYGYHTIALGRRILRTETASQYVLAAISFYFEQMGG